MPCSLEAWSPTHKRRILAPRVSTKSSMLLRYYNLVLVLFSHITIFEYLEHVQMCQRVSAWSFGPNRDVCHICTRAGDLRRMHTRASIWDFDTCILSTGNTVMSRSGKRLCWVPKTCTILCACEETCGAHVQQNCNLAYVIKSSQEAVGAETPFSPSQGRWKCCSAIIRGGGGWLGIWFWQILTTTSSTTA